ncbi:MAG: hypothetical protein IPO15_23255 [Anaerolineae bacterium]|uniref:hypothetical protein n=1 Tax=Candidatus Amarolinea dominans TaxID=3140696 RepID=UPI00313686DB|nr:hypothetical protein [Anaerolineae bacterium]
MSAPDADNAIEIPGDEAPLDEVDVPPDALLAEALPAMRITPGAAPARQTRAGDSPSCGRHRLPCPHDRCPHAPPIAAPLVGPAPTPSRHQNHPARTSMDDLLAAVPGAADDALTEDILAALPPTASSPPPASDAAEPITTVRSPVTPIQRHTDPCAIGGPGLPVVMEPTTPTPQPPGGRAGPLACGRPGAGRPP